MHEPKAQESRAQVMMRQAGTRRAIFLDRDGTILDEVGYLNHISRFRMLPGAAAAIRRLNLAGVPVIVVTNQSGVARGFFREEMVGKIHERMALELGAAGAHVDGIYYCPHGTEKGCDCRKPFPGMLTRAAEEHGLEISGSGLVSDRYDDIAMGHAAGCFTVLVMTGYGRGEYEWNQERWAHQPDFVAEDTGHAVDILLREMK
jgi:D-glycero-D-manno-heptose 1,7-bisphosphate phosphatase